MDFQIVQDFISAVGFPIGCCVYMMVCNNKQLKELSAAVNGLTNAVQILLHDNGDHDRENISKGEVD